jgi:hypothetical protein
LPGRNVILVYRLVYRYAGLVYHHQERGMLNSEHPPERKREPHNAVRGVDQVVWKESVRVAKNRDEDHGELVTRALRRELAALQEPITADILPAWPDTPNLTIVEVDAARHIAQWLADRRTGKYQGRVPARQLQIIRLSFEQALNLPPSSRGMRLLTARRDARNVQALTVEQEL